MKKSTKCVFTFLFRQYKRITIFDHNLKGLDKSLKDEIDMR